MDLSRGLGDVYKRQVMMKIKNTMVMKMISKTYKICLITPHNTILTLNHEI
jgi:hypothetical protein